MDGPPLLEPHPIIFNAIDRKVIKQAAMGTSGSAGASDVDADGWRHMCSSFTDVSQSLCSALALCAQRLASTYDEPESMVAYTSCRLIPLDKSPGVRPIGIGEVIRRIIGKAILSVADGAVKEVAGCVQLCAGQDSGML